MYPNTIWVQNKKLEAITVVVCRLKHIKEVQEAAFKLAGQGGPTGGQLSTETAFKYLLSAARIPVKQLGRWADSLCLR